ncbi:regulatory protein RecX [Methylomarinum vadi]|uniref:regulatory protein RecX n=1 Tax=Methylomarinum vadi TaxID=438855 RepID=UPI0004DFC751|nr:regulatory protein RecX [Methylomarinum vadi]
MTEKDLQIKDICLRLLARREHSRKELLDKLAFRGFGRQDTERVVQELAEQGWQSDERYAHSYARQRIEKGYGPLRIAYELQQHGVEYSELDGLVEDLAGSWSELLENVYLGKYSVDKHLPAKEWLKRSRFLQQRGFSGEMIKKLFVHMGIRLER